MDGKYNPKQVFHVLALMCKDLWQGRKLLAIFLALDKDLSHSQLCNLWMHCAPEKAKTKLFCLGDF